MLEGLATWVLNNYLGQYLENLNTDQLSIGLLKGEVELENVPLRKDALRHLDMALEVKAGFVGKVKLQIPVTKLRSEPWIIAFEQLYLVAGPIDLQDYDEEAEESAKCARKILQLETIETSWRTAQQQKSDDSPYESSYASWVAYGTSFVTNIIENIQLKIQDVHIRYEDDCSIPGEIFACGLTIDYLAVQSSDQHWVPKFIVAGEKNMSYKLLELKNLGFYLDSVSEVYSNKGIGELALLMVSSINGLDHDYILRPVSATAFLKRNLSLSPLKSRTTPRFTCDLKLENFPLYLNDLQYNQIISSLRYYDRIETARLYRKWRPKCNKIKGNACSWWKYAFDCHLNQIHKKLGGRNWEFAFEKAKLLNEYVSIYLTHLRSPLSVSPDMKQIQMQYENESSFEELRLIREICMKKVALEMDQKIVLKEETSKPFTPANQPTSPSSTGSNESAGFLQYWFPGWGGWYSKETSEKEEHLLLEEPIEDYSMKSPEPEISPSLSLEEEILYVISDSIENNTFMKRDAVFGQLCFSLKQGSFALSNVEIAQDTKEEKRIPLFELKFSSVKIAVESRPRNQSFSFNVELGSMSLKDQVTKNSAFPLLISQQRDGSTLAQKVGVGKGTTGVYARLSSMISSVSRLNPTAAAASHQEPLFSLSYERKPRNIKHEHKLIITSQALDIVYNQLAFKSIAEFFTISSIKREENQMFQSWTSSARKRYEELKQQTKEELKKNWNKIMEGAGIINIERKKWDLQLDISAPQIILPEHFEDSNATVVVLDFGKLIFCTAGNDPQNSSLDATNNSDDEDNFATPCSTPEELTLMEEIESKSSLRDDGNCMSESDLHAHLYDKYDLRLSDLQVLVAKVRDNWRFAYQKGTGPMHVLDRFSISLHLEHRTLPILSDYSIDSGHQWPNLMLSGTLPQLVVHINEQKVQAIKNFVSSFMSAKQQQSPIRTPKESNKSFAPTSVLHHSDTMTSINQNAPEEDDFEALEDQTKLIVMQFNVDKLSLELQSRGRSIAELQVTGVKAQLNKRLFDLSGILTVHSLLLVDALQTFGPDFELLVASHKHISMDSVSGSLLDSEPCSPTSPASPDPYLPVKTTSPLALSQALSSLTTGTNRAHSPNAERLSAKSPPTMVSPTFGSSAGYVDGRDTEALISVEVDYVSSASSNQTKSESHLFSSVQFNALDVIANQETVVELVGFLQQIFSCVTSNSSSLRGSSLKNNCNGVPGPPPTPPPPTPPPSSFTTETISKEKESRPSFYGSIASLYPPDASENTSPTRAEVSFDFHKLTILLLRGSLKDKEMVGRKVGTAVLSDAKIQSSVVSDILTVEGSLGGFQIRDVTPEGNKHQCIVSVGHDPIVERSQDLVSRLNSGIYQPFSEQMKERNHKAFSFKVIRPLVLSSPYEDTELLEMYSAEDYVLKNINRGDNKLKLELRLASVVYTHSPQFLSELKSCATEFKQYMTKVAQSIKQAATEMAIGLVSKRIESFASLGSASRDSPRHIRHLSLSKSTDTLLFPNPPPASTLDSNMSPVHSMAPDLTFNTEIDLILETPIVVIPESSNSSSVIVGHLGQISVNNKQTQPKQQDQHMFFSSRSATFQISVKDISLYSLNVDERLRSRDITFHPLSTTMMLAEELYSCRDHGLPIVHDASLELVLIQKRDPELLSDYQSGLVFSSDIYLDSQETPMQDSFMLEGGFVTPLKVSVSRHQYQQISKTLDNISMPSLQKSTSVSEGRKLLNPIYENELSNSPKAPADGENPPEEFNTDEEQKSCVPIKGQFTIPSLCIELRGDVGQMEQQPLVNLVLHEISAVYEALQPHETNTQITLRSLVMEDMQFGDPNGTHRYLIKSEDHPEESESESSNINIPKAYSGSTGNFISTSCPEFWNQWHTRDLSSSLPSKLETEKPFYKLLKNPLDEVKKRNYSVTPNTCSEHSVRCPCTPPPSPTTEPKETEASMPVKDGALVNISIHSIDEKSPQFMIKYDGTHRFVDINLNRLVTVVNLESWVMLFDFFRALSSDPLNKYDSEGKSNETRSHSSSSQDTRTMVETNTVMEIQVRCLTLVLNKTEGELASASINEVFVRSVGTEGNLTLNGKLGSLSVQDLTSYGKLYKNKFITSGKEAMTFQLFRYSQEDPDLTRECDIRLKLKMSSIMYVHSQRFTIEMLQFFQQFILLRDIVTNWRATSAGLKVTEKKHGTRVSMDITAGSPVVFIPMSNYSDILIVADLGSFSLSNKFLWSGSEGTISQVRREVLSDRLLSSGSRMRSRSGSLRSRSRSGSRRQRRDGSMSRESSTTSVKHGQRCLLDIMQLNLVNMDLYSCERIELKKRKTSKSSSSPEEEQEVGWNFKSYKVVRKGSSLLKENCALKVQVERNLDGDISRIVPDLSIYGVLNKIHATVDVATYKLIRGLLDFNLGEQIDEPSFPPTFLSFCQTVNVQSKIQFPSSHVWTTLNIHFDLDNVIIDAELCDNQSSRLPFSCVNLIKSRLSYESFSDSSKDVDLVSQEILISDTRFKDFPANKRSNVFTNILQPASDKSLMNENPLQAEVHFRSTKDVMRFTILVNNMRLMAILDWWKEAESFIQSSHPRPLSKDLSKSGSSSVNVGDTPERSSLNLPSTSTQGGSKVSFKINAPRLNPMVESTGLMTKHNLISDVAQVPFELKINVTDSELVIVENSKVWDTSAVILKSTAVVSYRPQFQEHPVSCNLNQCELYSCTLGLEDETALSIIDPVTINIEINDQDTKRSASELASISFQPRHNVEISLHQLNVRLSYHDMKLFQRILESLPRQRNEVSHCETSNLKDENQTVSGEPANITAQVERLSVLGFSTDDCIKSMKECGGKLDEAALWLTQNAQPVVGKTFKESSVENKDYGMINIQGFELKTGSINLTIIDDCGDCDVPLLEVCFSHLGLKQNSEWIGSAFCTLSLDYYNRALSGWEPFIEPWKLKLEWKKFINREPGLDKLQISLESRDTVNLSLTSTLFDLYYLVKNNWTEDYYTRERQDVEVMTFSKKDAISSQSYRRRTPFVPFALKNDTGCDLHFFPLTESDSDLQLDNKQAIQGSVADQDWKLVTSGEISSFSFDELAGKQRHVKSHDLKYHRVLVRVGDWRPVGPVTVDKVGVYFRMAHYKDPKNSYMPSVRIVFSITMDGLARKLITVRSALLITNRLPHPIEIKMENISFRLGDVCTMQVGSRSTICVPLLSVWSRIFVKPLSVEVARSWIYCREKLHWTTLLQAKAHKCDVRTCDPVNARHPLYRFVVNVRRDNYPIEIVNSAATPPEMPKMEFGEYSRQQAWIQPGHSIILISPLTFVNLLPFDLHFEVKTSGDQGRLKPGEETYISSVDPEQEIEMCLRTDTMKAASILTIRPSGAPYIVPFKLQDLSGRPLHLQIKVHLQYGKALKISVCAYFWLINKTGLPIVFKQDGTNTDAAGQDEEHEVARSAAPLLFSFSDEEASPMVLARVGKSLHLNSHPQFCKKFPLTQGTWVRRLQVSLKDNHRPDIIYVVGIDVRTGKGRYRDTYMVTLSPRFHIENRSSHELLISQKCFTSPSINSGSQSTWLKAIPGCWLPFHWPRLDKDPLLCVCLCQISGCHWSGGFLVDRTDSFNINIRDNLGNCFFLRVEILMNDATFFIVFTDTDSLPPPFRIDNFSEVQITYYQTGTQIDRLRSTVKPRTCVPYAWDEITLSPHITCVAPGGTSATYNLNFLGDGARLTYENFIYISFTGTFPFYGSSRSSGYYDNKATLSEDHSVLDCLHLVLDVVEDTRVTLARKESGRRSQLWRMTSTGMLQHEGSSPPYDPTTKKPRNQSNCLVLDIAGPAPLPSEYTALMLRKPDERRRLTQTWKFTDDGRLCCQHPNMFVQAKDGFTGLTSGNDVVVGPPQRVHYTTMPNGVPLEQAVGKQRLRPGSGVLAIKVSTDGPTRVLQIVDAQIKNYPQVARMDNGDVVYINESGISVTSGLSTQKDKTIPHHTQNTDNKIEEIQVQLVLRGLGVSIVSFDEELLYAFLSNVILEVQSSSKVRMLDCSVRDIQIDNQLAKAQCPVVLYVSPQSKNDEARHLPAITISAHQLRSPNLNAYIFKTMMIKIKNLTLTIEEILLCKLLLFSRLDRTEKELQKVEESQYETRRLLAAATSANATRYYFTHLNIILNQLRLSVLTTKSLSPELKNCRKKMGLTMVQFENAQVSLDPFVKSHPFETWKVLVDSIAAHYESELKSQAMRILGSTDFLGNPVGFFSDVSEGVQELVREGNVGGLVLNVTHGMANSTAKVTGSLSDAVGRVMMDRNHEETRQRLLTRAMGQTQDHFVAGLMGFGLGLYGGLTSIVSQTYTGVSKEGFPGLFSGFAKGMVGTVTKPAIGFLDLASSAASAVRDTSKNPSLKLPSKTRKPRVVVGVNGMMPRYSEKLSVGQELLHILNQNSSERFIGYEILRKDADDLRILISSESILVFSYIETPSVVLAIEFKDLFGCQPLTIDSETNESLHYIELTLRTESYEGIVPSQSYPSLAVSKRPKVRCDFYSTATSVCQQINFARILHDELRHTLITNDEENSTDAF